MEYNSDKAFLRSFLVLFPVLVISVNYIIFPKLLESSNRSIYNYRCPRNSKGFNISLVRDNSGNVLIYNNKKQISTYIDSDDNSVKALFKRSFLTKKAFNVRVNDNSLIIYTEKSAGDEVYKLESANIKKFSDLISTKILPHKPIPLKFLKSLIYLLCTGYLDSHYILIYKRSIMLYSQDSRFRNLDVDLSALFDGDSFLNTEYFSGGKNSLLAFINPLGSNIYVVNSNGQIKGYSLYNFRDNMKEVLGCSRNKEISKMVRHGKYEEIVGMIKGEEFDKIKEYFIKQKGTKEIKKFVIFEEPDNYEENEEF